MKIAGYSLLLLMPWGLLSGRAAAQTSLYPMPILSATQAVAAVTAGDFDPRHSGNELACLMADGSVVELAHSEAGWAAETIFVYKGSSAGLWQPGMRVTLNIGDVIAPYAGKELVLSFQEQVVAIYRGPPGAWTNQIIADLAGLVATCWGAEVGDCDRAHPGEEVFSIVEGVLDFSIGTVYSEANGAWPANLVYSGEVGMDAVIGDSNPDLVGDEIIVVTEMGPAYEITPPPSGGPGPWPKRTIWDDFENAGWVGKIGDVEPEIPGNELVYGTRYSDSILLSKHNGTNQHVVNILMTGVDTNVFGSMLDVAIGQVFPASLAAEILGVDMSGSVYVVQRLANQWQGAILWRDTKALYAVVAADLIPTIPGDEIIVAGASGTLTLLCNPAPILNLSSAAQQAVLSWTALTGLTYCVETSTNLASDPSWRQIANLTYHGDFTGVLAYTNAEVPAAQASFFRVKASQ